MVMIDGMSGRTGRRKKRPPWSAGVVAGRTRARTRSRVSGGHDEVAVKGAGRWGQIGSPGKGGGGNVTGRAGQRAAGRAGRKGREREGEEKKRRQRDRRIDERRAGDRMTAVGDGVGYQEMDGDGWRRLGRRMEANVTGGTSLTY